MGKKSPKAPDPQTMINAQADANRISTYTPFGNVQYGNVDASGNFTPNTSREASYVSLSPQQQQLMNYSDAAKAQMFGDIFGTYTPYTAPGNNGATNGTSNTGISDNSLASSMAKPVGGYSSNGNMITTPFGSTVDASKTRLGWGLQYDDPYTKSVMESQGYSLVGGQPTQQTSATGTPLPGSGNNAGGVGTFTGGSKMVDPTIGNWMDWSALTAPGMNNFGDPNLKNGIRDFYDLDSIKGSLPSVSQDFSGDRKRVEDAVYNRAVGLVAPQFEERNRRLQQMLADQGLTIGGEAYGGEMDRLNRMENEAYSNAALDAITRGGDEYQRMADLGLRTRGQLFGEDTSLAQLMASQRGQQFGENQSVFDANNTIRNMQFNERLAALNASNTQRGQAEQTRTRQFNERAALMGLQPIVPQPINTPQIDAMSPYNNAYAGQMANYQSNMQGLSSLLGAGATAAGLFFSDKRAKTDIEKVREIDGINVYQFRYKGSPEKYEGVIAQEVEHIPGVVHYNDDGMRLVDYSKLPVEFKKVA